MARPRVLPETPLPSADAPILQARLMPHRSLSPAGFAAVMALVGFISFVSGLAFWLRGAWPVAGFCGLDVAVMWCAFRANFRAARACEEIEVTFDEIRLTRVDARGNRVEWRCNPVWAGLDIDRHVDEGVTGLALRSRGQRQAIGAFLGPAERGAFAEVLAAALRQAKAGRDYSAMPA